MLRIMRVGAHHGHGGHARFEHVVIPELLDPLLPRHLAVPVGVTLVELLHRSLARLELRSGLGLGLDLFSSDRSGELG